MHRRRFIASAASAGVAGMPAAAAAKSSYIELRYMKLRNGPQLQRTNDFLAKAVAPALQRAGVGPTGFFSAVIGEQSPFVLGLVSYPSLDAIEAAAAKLRADKEYMKASDEYNSMTELGYIRMENALLRGFESMPAVEVPAAAKSPRIFELRTYESNNTKAVQRKIGMFNQGEIGIFRRLGMTPVFFGETLFGTNLPNLTYMLAFEDLAAREKLWRAFGSDPEWQKLRATPGLSDAEIVSNISNAILRPLPFSQIR